MRRFAIRMTQERGTLFGKPATTIRQTLVDADTEEVIDEQAVEAAWRNLDATGYYVKTRYAHGIPGGLVRRIDSQFVYVDDVAVPRHRFHAMFEVD